MNFPRFMAATSIFLILAGAVLSNLAVWRMSKAMNTTWSFKDWRAADRIIRTYGPKHGNSTPVKVYFSGMMLVCLGTVAFVFSHR